MDKDTGARLNIEFKARCSDHEKIRKVLEQRNARFEGTDRQRDTYFVIPSGRLKLRQGNIENTLIFYDRPDKMGVKQSDVQLYRPERAQALYDVLTAALEVDVVVGKEREIYFVDNVKIHLDTVDQLGRFVEVEAIDADGSFAVEELKRQCDDFLAAFEISSDDFVAVSYSDLVRAAD